MSALPASARAWPGALHLRLGRRSTPARPARPTALPMAPVRSRAGEAVARVVVEPGAWAQRPTSLSQDLNFSDISKEINFKVPLNSHLKSLGLYSLLLGHAPSF